MAEPRENGQKKIDSTGLFHSPLNKYTDTLENNENQLLTLAPIWLPH